MVDIALGYKIWFVTKNQRQMANVPDNSYSSAKVVLRINGLIWMADAYGGKVVCHSPWTELVHHYDEDCGRTYACRNVAEYKL